MHTLVLNLDLALFTLAHLTYFGSCVSKQALSPATKHVLPHPFPTIFAPYPTLLCLVPILVSSSHTDAVKTCSSRGAERGQVIYSLRSAGEEWRGRFVGVGWGWGVRQRGWGLACASSSDLNDVPSIITRPLQAVTRPPPAPAHAHITSEVM